MRIAVCDDERRLREQIREWILSHRPQDTVDVFDSGEALLDVRQGWDILFLDIRMPGRNGMEVANHFCTADPAPVVIFLTGWKDYVFQAFDVGAFHYLIKPVDRGKFVQVLDKAVQAVHSRKEAGREPVYIATRNRKLTVDRSRILYVESRARKVEIHLKDEILTAYGTMKSLEAALGDGFYRCHRCYLVNMAHIQEYDTTSITMHNGEVVWLAKEKYKEFVTAYLHYLKNGGIPGV